MMRSKSRNMKGFASCGLWSLILCLLLLPACQGPPSSASSPAEVIRVAYPEPPLSALFDIAMEKGYFLEEGLAVTPQSFAGGKLALQAVLDGKADLAISADTPVMVAISGGQPISIVAQVATAGNNWTIMARRDRGITEPADLAGKTIGTPFGTAGDFFLDSFLSLNGIARTQVTRKNLSPGEMSAALMAGTVDAVSIRYPYILPLQQELGDRGIVFAEDAISSTLACLSSSQPYATDHLRAIANFLKGLIRAETFVKQDSAESQRLVADFNQIAPEQVAEVWASLDLRVSLEQALLVSLEDQTRWAQANQIVGGTTVPNYLNFIYFAGLDAVRPESITIVR